jgi:hypothetical protein
MKWFRSNVKHGSRLALFALAIQFALSFGHFHGVAAQAAPAIQTGLTQADLANIGTVAAPDAASKATEKQPPSNHDRDRHSTDACAICAVIALANSVLFATPPVLPLPLAIESSYLTSDAGFVHLNTARVAFQPRAPPLS